MQEQEKKRILETYEYGSQSFSEDDLKKVMADAETAKHKSSKLGDQIENFKLLWSLLKDYYNKEYTTVP